MKDFNYEKTFELMKAYGELGAIERRIMEYLFKLDFFEGTYSQLAKEINMDARNLTNTLKYLNALGIVYIKNEKYLDELEFTNKNGKIHTSINKMKACFIVDGWMETLIRKYHDGKITQKNNEKRQIIEEDNKIIFEEMGLKYKVS